MCVASAEVFTGGSSFLRAWDASLAISPIDGLMDGLNHCAIACAIKGDRVNYGRPSVTDYRQAEWLDDRQTNWLACDQLGPLDSAAMR